MSHLDEFTLMMYLDRELTAEEASQVEAHLALCPSCRQYCSRMQADEELFFTAFAESSSLPESPLELNPFTQAQVEAIASLHRRHREHPAWRALGWPL
jgi:anti-sigma factor RsiW